MLDFDAKWGDALRVGDVIEDFLRDIRNITNDTVQEYFSYFLALLF